MLIRVRSKNGTWRVGDLTPASTIADIKRWIFDQHSIAPAQQQLALDQQGAQQTTDAQTLRELRVGHGDMLFLDYDGETVSTGGTVGTKINADGMKSLRDMKMYWTLGEFMRMDAQFEFKISAQKEPHVAKVHLDGASCNDFQAYLRQFAFQQSRCGWLYGSVDSETKEVTVDFIYEPPQEGNPYGFEVLDDPNADKVDAVAEALGYEKVGWVFSHPPREDEDFHFSAREILLAAQLQADAGGKGSLFLTLKVTLDKEGQASFEAFQVSDQCVEMFAAGALMETEQNPKACAVSDTFTALVEAKPATEVDNNFFLCVVPVVPHESPLRCEFPKLNREGAYRNRAALKTQLQKYRDESYAKRISDFQLLVFLSDFLDVQTDIPAICQAVRDPNTPLDSGYPILIDSVAGSQ
ncbi:Dihydrolipoyllysine-residue succinyltransferase [Phytophthora nicotianae]|uniref:Dihydrolipoyllysine-residue succinyltransferase n=1 Tax=Phytophthora nicotianae TaxID=4792 RepID=A0A0W8DJI3_PHYNI|nr:Dihydrolipoyllysine-residue succinyltransferase [Phytophthora nicotianae]